MATLAGAPPVAVSNAVGNAEGPSSVPAASSPPVTTGPDSLEIEGYPKGSGPYTIAWPDASKPNQGDGTITGLPIVGVIAAPDGQRYMLDKTGANSGDLANQIQGPLLADVTNTPPANPSAVTVAVVDVPAAAPVPAAGA
jgi:hypothetical protein